MAYINNASSLKTMLSVYDVRGSLLRKKKKKTQNQNIQHIKLSAVSKVVPWLYKEKFLEESFVYQHPSDFSSTGIGTGACTILDKSLQRNGTQTM